MLQHFNMERLQNNTRKAYEFSPLNRLKMLRSARYSARTSFCSSMKETMAGTPANTT